jgi:hypothetical protein
LTKRGSSNPAFPVIFNVENEPRHPPSGGRPFGRAAKYMKSGDLEYQVRKRSLDGYTFDAVIGETSTETFPFP